MPHSSPLQDVGDLEGLLVGGTGTGAVVPQASPFHDTGLLVGDFEGDPVGGAVAVVPHPSPSFSSSFTSLSVRLLHFLRLHPISLQMILCRSMLRFVGWLQHVSRSTCLHLLLRLLLLLSSLLVLSMPLLLSVFVVLEDNEEDFGVKSK